VFEVSFTLSRSQEDSSLASAQALADYFETNKIVFANAETKMNAQTIRLHVRILKRVSMAVTDQGAPCYKDSALFFFDQIEGVFGRKSIQMTMQENNRTFDSFVAAVTDFNDLRLLAETYYVMLLRDYPVKITARTAAETARGILCSAKIPPALIERYSAHAGVLADYVSLRTFHAKYGTNRDFDGHVLKVPRDIACTSSSSSRSISSSSNNSVSTRIDIISSS
jgi:hypothetical protein